MGAPTTIDADTHVDETEDTWEYMRPDEQDIKPVVGYPSNPDPNRPPTRYWLIDGERQPRLFRTDERTKTTVETRELLDVRKRLDDMDKLNVQTQVIFPTTLLIQPTLKPRTDFALKRSYNRWMADRCAQSGGRLRWMALAPVMGDLEDTIKELRWCKDNGAVGVFKKGDREGDHYLADPYFYPLWKEVEALNMPVCFHTGSGVFDRIPTREATFAVGRLAYPVMTAFQALVQHRIPQQFPGIRWGFIEAGSAWVPWAVYTLARRLARPGESQRLNFEVKQDLLKEFNLFVTCQVDEDLPYIMQFTGEDNLIVGSDYCHADQSQEHDFQDRLRQRAQSGEISMSAVEKILLDNPRRLYGL